MVVGEVGVDTYLWVGSLTRAACMPFVMSQRRDLRLVVLRIINFSVIIKVVAQ